MVYSNWCNFQNYIEDHYFENGDLFTKEIEDFETLRQVCVLYHMHTSVFGGKF